MHVFIIVLANIFHRCFYHYLIWLLLSLQTVYFIIRLVVLFTAYYMDRLCKCQPKNKYDLWKTFLLFGDFGVYFILEQKRDLIKIPLAKTALYDTETHLFMYTFTIIAHNLPCKTYFKSIKRTVYFYESTCNFESSYVWTFYYFFRKLSNLS